MDDYTANAVQLGMLSPEARAAMVGVNPKVTLRAARERLEHAASQAEQKALKNWVFQYERKLEAQRQNLLRQSMEADRERATETTLRLREIQAELAGAANDAERGRISSEQLRQATLKANREAEQARALSESMSSGFDSREQLKAADLADLQDDELKRFPVMADRLPALLGEITSAAPAFSARIAGNINPAESIRGHADELYGAVRDAVRALESTEARERTLAGPVTNDAAERIPAMGSRR